MIAESPILLRADRPGKRISMALAIAVHLLLAAFLFYGVRWQTKATDVVEVELVRAMPESVVAPAAAPPLPAVEPPPAPAPAPKPEPRPAPPAPKPDIAIKEKEKPKPPPKVEPKPLPPKPEPKPRVDPFQEQLKRESELAQRKNADSAAQEFAQKQAAQAASARNKAMTDYLGRIRGKIRGNIVLPPEVKGNPEAVFDVTQLPSGDILTVQLKRSSGNAALDAAIERAIRKSSPLPKAEPADLFSRSLELRYRPRDD